jgi:hypothetical protein
MLNLTMFIISMLSVGLSSYLICSTLKSKRFINNLIFYSLIYISQIIITFELLSFIKQINSTGVLIINFIILFLTITFWKIKKYPVIDFPDTKPTFNNIKYALSKDICLKILLILLIFSGSISLFLTLATPSNSVDSLAYHIARIGFWIQNQSLFHYETSSIRQLVFPINSEILILWSMVFLKRDYLAQMPEYLSYIGCLIILFGFMSYIKISTRRILWAIFILASLPSIILESMSSQTNLIIAFLLLSSLYLFIYGVKERHKISMIFSAIAYSIALGTKSTAFLFLPVFALIFILISINERKRDFYKPILIFSASIIPAFIILASFNFILNFIDYGSPFSPPAFMQQHSPGFSFKGFITNIIKYLILFVDFSGIKHIDVINSLIIGFKDNILHVLGLNTNEGLAFNDFKITNFLIHENYSMYGILGFVLFLPLIIKAMTKTKLNKNKSFIISLSGLIFIGFLLSISSLMGFCLWFNRFFLSAIILSSPVFIFSYCKKYTAWKIFITIVAGLNMIFIPVFNLSKPLFPTISGISKYNIEIFRNEFRLRSYKNIQSKSYIYGLIKYLNQIAPNNSKIAFISAKEEIFYPFFEENLTWKIFPLRYDLLYKKKNYNDYDFIIIPEEKQQITVPNKNKVHYNYSINNKEIIYNNYNAQDLIIVYNDINNKPTVSEIPSTMSVFINLSDIPPNFKLLRTFSIFIEAPYSDNNYTYYVYKKSKL